MSLVEKKKKNMDQTRNKYPYLCIKRNKAASYSRKQPQRGKTAKRQNHSGKTASGKAVERPQPKSFSVKGFYF